jgi:hypothetical protein
MIQIFQCSIFKYAVTRSALAAVLGLCTLQTVHAQVYKWVDEKGVTQYTTTPPPMGKGQTIINTPTPARAATAKPASKEKTWQEKEAEFRERRATTAEQQHNDEVARAGGQRKAGEQRESCTQARRDLQLLQEQRPVYTLDERGERKYVDDKDRPRLIETLKQEIARDCPK